MKILAIANQKGGVGKTTTAVTLAHGLALQGKRTLIIDLDTQGNAADALGMESGSELFDWLIKGEWKPMVARDDLYLIRSDKYTAVLKQTLAGMDFRETVLARGLEIWSQAYDYCVMDCAPSVDILHTAALVAADQLLIPTRLDQFAVKGATEIMTSLAAVKLASRSECELAGILPTFYDKVTNESQMQLVNLAEAFGELVWAPIAQDNSCRVANRKGKTLWEIPRGRALAGYEGALGKVLEWR